MRGRARSRYKKYLEYRLLVKRIRISIILLIMMFFLTFLGLEQHKIDTLPADFYVIKILNRNDMINVKFLSGKLDMELSKTLFNRIYKRISYLYFISRGYIISLRW